jgi:hypothetical protein
VALTVRLDTAAAAAAQATLTLEGPDGVWFGAGFNATTMADAPWTVVVDGAGAVTERQLGDHTPGTALAASVTVVSNAVVGGRRTVVLTRALAGATAAHYSFDLARDTVLHAIVAVGSTPALAYHKAKTGVTLAVLPEGAPVCVCALAPAPFGSGKGSLYYAGPGPQSGSSVGFGNHCPPPPRCDLLAQRNPTCDVRTYVGGQTSCHHLWYLLDADQADPWPTQPLEYHLKFRFWYQAYDPTYHAQVYRTTWGLASPVEYDVPQCADGTPTDQCVHTITGLFDVGEQKGKQMKLVAAHFHCHAPTCLSVSLYNNGTGELLCEEKAVYGGHGAMGGAKFEEPGFIAVPPCLWGRAEDGLEPPPVVSGQTLYGVKHTNSTYGHHGEMAWLQVLYILE